MNKSRTCWKMWFIDYPCSLFPGLLHRSLAVCKNRRRRPGDLMVLHGCGKKLCTITVCTSHVVLVISLPGGGHFTLVLGVAWHQCARPQGGIITITRKCRTLWWWAWASWYRILCHWCQQVKHPPTCIIHSPFTGVIFVSFYKSKIVKTCYVYTT